MCGLGHTNNCMQVVSYVEDGRSGRTNQVTGQILCFTASRRQARDGEALQLQKKQILGEARRGYPRFEVENERLAQDS